MKTYAHITSNNAGAAWLRIFLCLALLALSVFSMRAQECYCARVKIEFPSLKTLR